MAKIDIDKFVASLIKHYCEAYGIDRASIRCWFDDALEEQGLEYKDGGIVKTQRKVVAGAKEAIFDNGDEKIMSDFESALFSAISDLWQSYMLGEEIDIAKWVKQHSLPLLEKQPNKIPEECVYRPLAGCDINSAAKQAIEQQGVLAKKIVLVFNGIYIPVKGKSVQDIVYDYYSRLPKTNTSNI